MKNLSSVIVCIVFIICSILTIFCYWYGLETMDIATSTIPRAILFSLLFFSSLFGTLVFISSFFFHFRKWLLVVAFFFALPSISSCLWLIIAVIMKLSEYWGLLP
jgi:hypothetical protein